MADQMRTTPDPDSAREVDWGERLLASMNETSAEADESTKPAFDEEDDLAALLRAQLARQKEDPIPDLLDTTEFEEDEEDIDEEELDEEEFNEEEFDEEELDEEELDEEELDEEELDEEELDEEELDEEELDEEELDEEEFDEEEFDEEEFDEEELDEEELDEEELDEEELDEEEFDEEEFDEDEEVSEQELQEEKFKELFVTEEPEENVEVYPEDEYAEDDYIEGEYIEDEYIEDEYIEEEEEELPVAAEDLLPDNTLNGSVFCESGDDGSATTSMQSHSQSEALRAVLAENTQILEEEQERREAAIHGLADPSSEANVDLSNVAAIVHDLPAEEPKDDDDVFASRHRAQPRSSVISYDPLQIGHEGGSARVVADILDGELPVGAYAKPETECKDYTTEMVGTSESDVHLRDTALWMDMGYGSNVRHAEERRAAEQARSDDAPLVDADRRADTSTRDKVKAVRAELESARKKYPRARLLSLARLIAAFVGVALAVLYGCLPVAEELVSTALSPSAYPLLGLAWTVLIALPFVTRLARGVMGLVRFAPTRYSVTAIAMAVSLIYTAISAIACAVNGTVLPPIDGIPLCMLTLAALSEFLETVGDGDALSIVSSGRALYVLTDAETPAATTLSGYAADELAPRKAHGPLTALRTAVVDHAVARMKQYNPYMSRLNYLLPAALGAAIVVAGVSLLREGHLILDGVRIFAVTYLAALPAAYLVAMSLPLHIANSRMRPMGCAVVGAATPETYVRPGSARRKREILLSERDMIVAARRKEITLRDEDPASVTRWRRMANRLFHLLDIPLAADFPFEDDQSPEALEHLHVEISEIDVHYMKAYLVDDTPNHVETVEVVMGSHDALSRRGIRLPKRAMESVYRKSEDSHVLYLAFNGRFRVAYAAEYRVHPAASDVLSRLAACGMRPVMVSYDPMLTSSILMEPRFAALGNIEVTRPDYTDVQSTLCSSGMVATHGNRDLVYPLASCRRMHTCNCLSHALAWLGYAAVSALSLVAVLLGGDDYINTATAVLAQVLLVALFILVSWLVVYRPAFKACIKRLIARITKK